MTRRNAIKQGLKLPWISIKEKLPDFNDIVLGFIDDPAYFDGHKIYAVKRILHKNTNWNWVYAENEEWDCDRYLTHWLPMEYIPEP